MVSEEGDTESIVLLTLFWGKKRNITTIGKKKENRQVVDKIEQILLKSKQQAVFESHFGRQ